MRNFMKKNKRAKYQRICKNCKISYIAKKPHSKFCTSICRMEYWRKTHPQLTAAELRAIKERLGIQE